MRTLKLLKMGMVGLVGVFASLLMPSVSQAIVSPGYDLLYTEYANYNGVDFKGLEFGTYDFNDGNGPVGVGNADTILHRSVAVTPTQTISYPDFKIFALSLISVNPVFETPGTGGNGDGICNTGETCEQAVTRDVKDTGSTITISDDGTFTSSLKFTFDLIGASSGLLIDSFNDLPLELTQASAPWSSTPPKHAVVIPNVTSDFFTGRATHFGQFIHHITVTATAPEPASFLLLGTGIGLLAYRRRKAA